MLKIGITGGIGAGKSLISKILMVQGFPVFNSDFRAKEILMNHPEVSFYLLTEFGESVFVNHKPDRAKLAKLVFSDKKALEKLNGIIHPLVGMAFKDWISNQSSSIVFKEAAILVESGNYKELDKLIVVTAPVAVRVQRIILRDQISEQEVFLRMNNQISDDKRNSFADFIIENDDHHPVLPQVLRILEDLKKLC